MPYSHETRAVQSFRVRRSARTGKYDWSQVPTFGIHAPPASGLGRLRRSPIVRRRPHVLAVLAASCLIAASTAGPAAAQSKGKALVRLAHFAENVAVGDIYVVFVNGRQKFN